MKRDIRDLFKEESKLKTLPENHREQFLGKLQKEAKLNKVSNRFFWLGIAAFAIIALTVGFNIFSNEAKKEEVTPVLAQIEAVEAEYLEGIEKEWRNFVAIADDEVLVARFKKKLDELHKDYQEISLQFREDSDNILVVEALVDNLQNRLQILKDIQKHIKILNQKNKQHESTI